MSETIIELKKNEDGVYIPDEVIVENKNDDIRSEKINTHQTNALKVNNLSSVRRRRKLTPRESFLKGFRNGLDIIDEIGYIIDEYR